MSECRKSRKFLHIVVWLAICIGLGSLQQNDLLRQTAKPNRISRSKNDNFKHLVDIGDRNPWGTHII